MASNDKHKQAAIMYVWDMCVRMVHVGGSTIEGWSSHAHMGG